MRFLSFGFRMMTNKSEVGSMIDDVKLQDALSCYKRDFNEKRWNDEKYKWEAIKRFQDNWNIEDPDFASMLAHSLEGTKNLLNSDPNDRPEKLINELAKEDAESVRTMFRELFDESGDVVERIFQFKTEADKLARKYKGEKNKSFQDLNAITVYLWLRYPDKYFIYRYTDAQKTADELGSDANFSKNDEKKKARDFFALYGEICNELKKDDELKRLLNSHLTLDCYGDPKFRTLTQDFGYYISRVYSDRDETWFPNDLGYTPGISVEKWKELLKDPEIFNEDSLEIMLRMMKIGGRATCKQLADKYGGHFNSYKKRSCDLAERVQKKTNCPVLKEDDGTTKWWPILYVGKEASKKGDGSFIWRLRPELEAALKETDLSKVKLYADPEQKEDSLPIEEPTPEETRNEPYTREDFLKDVYISGEEYDRINYSLERKKNIILQGAPGVGKTFAANRLAYSMMGEKDKSRIAFVQFHQSYSYEDFVMGYKPEGDSFRLKEGIFYKFCKKAAEDPERCYFFIIDEINRGNLSKIFGELLMLIEADKRVGYKATLAYSDEEFSVPDNLYIIGMMNTADRSLAMIDYALRRRFSFIDMEPAFDSAGFKEYQKGLGNKTFDDLIDEVKELNKTIENDKSLGKGFCIGHSYFCNIRSKKDCSTQWMRNIVDYDILPMLSEYWFDKPEKVEDWKGKFDKTLSLK